jgi:Cupin-like domain
MGPPPTRDNDMNFATWAHHARYADAVRLPPHKPHYYWQSWTDIDERDKVDPKLWSFISRDLPSFSSKKANFFLFRPEAQKGIQCRFGERGTLASTHTDFGRNMVAMVHGAKRYILSPPRECYKMGVITNADSGIFRHSLLNFGHLKYLKDPPHSATAEEPGKMSRKERLWLQAAGKAATVETIVKAGEVLYIPSLWFHYIVSLQKSTQCNVRSGLDAVGTPAFGNMSDIEECTRPG